MAFDGVSISNIVKELNDSLSGGRISKLAQPESDELLLTVKTSNGQKRLVLSVSASLPLVYLTESNKPSPMTAPGFCMLLRKHLLNGRIVAITQPGLERVVCIVIEHLDEMGDLKQKKLITEIMGKHSNIILCDEEDKILDSIKHISSLVSSVREVLPGKTWFIPQTQLKADPLSTDEEEFGRLLSGKPLPLFKAIYSSYTGISPVLAQELCYEAGADGDRPGAALSDKELHGLYEAFHRLMQRVKEKDFAPCIAYTGKQPVEFAAVPLTMYTKEPDRIENQPSMSALLEAYYAEKSQLTRIRQKSADLRHVVQLALERDVRKLDLQRKQMKDAQKKDTYRVWGELLHTYGYQAQPGSKSLEALNYYTNEMITIPLDPHLTPGENAQKYFEKYNKMKRTYEALTEQTAQVEAEIAHLESINTSLDIALLEEDLAQIREELMASGYIRRKGGKKEKITSKPFHYVSSDGFSIYVGKNNYQNEDLTFRLATGNDWWFHAKDRPGSHVIVKTEGTSELPDATFEEAARLAAYYSKGRGTDKIEVDYTQKKNVKKPSGGKPGFVVYYTNYSMLIDTDISGIRQMTS